jgi:hypothetical protein
MSDDLKSWLAQRDSNNDSFRRLMNGRNVTRSPEDLQKAIEAANQNHNRDADVKMWAGIGMIILGIPLSAVIIGIPMIVVGLCFTLYYGGFKRRF